MTARDARRQIAILQLFAEAQRKARPRRLNLALADTRRDRHRASVVDQELGLLVSTRRGVSLRLCYLCGSRVELRDGRRTLLEHRCVDGRVRAPLWPRVDLRIARMAAEGIPATTIALRLGLVRHTVYKHSRGGTPR